MHRPTLIAAVYALTALTALGVLGGPTATAGTEARTTFTRPTVPGWEISNPGVIVAGDASGGVRYVVLETGGALADGTISTATDATDPGSWTRATDQHLLDHLPTYASGADGLWAPSGIGDGVTQRDYTFYSAPVRGHTRDAVEPPRCIFTGVSATNYLDPTPAATLGPAMFRAYDKPLVCWQGWSGKRAADQIGRPAPNFSLIDPTPTLLDGKLFLTYKTQRKVDREWITTIRMVRLDPTDPGRKIIGRDRQLTSWRSTSIEENPVVVQHGGKYVLFTSRGWYHSDCRTSPHPYRSVYRVSGHLWRWTGRKVHRLQVPKGVCGTGNAQPAPSLNGPGDLFFFNGRWPQPTGRQGGLHLYVGRLTWHRATPSVTTLFH